MYVFGIGNVTSCSSSWIHLNNEGKQNNINATEDALLEIYKVASENVNFYRRMFDEIKALYEKLTEEAVKKYPFITDEDIEKARERGDKDWIYLEWTKDSRNLEATRNRCEALGTYNGCEYAHYREWEAKRIKSQAESALNEIKHRNPKIKKASFKWNGELKL